MPVNVTLHSKAGVTVANMAKHPKTLSNNNTVGAAADQRVLNGLSTANGLAEGRAMRGLAVRASMESFFASSAVGPKDPAAGAMSLQLSRRDARCA
jgi:hypothetical protein